MPRGKALDKGWIEEHKETVRKLASYGCTNDEIADVIGLPKGSLERPYQAMLDEGRSKIRATLRKTQLELAIQDKNPTMLIWLGKQLLGQREPKWSVEHSGQIEFQKVIYSGKSSKDS